MAQLEVTITKNETVRGYWAVAVVNGGNGRTCRMQGGGRTPALATENALRQIKELGARPIRPGRRPTGLLGASYFLRG